MKNTAVRLRSAAAVSLLALILAASPVFASDQSSHPRDPITFLKHLVVKIFGDLSAPPG